MEGESEGDVIGGASDETHEAEHAAECVGIGWRVLEGGAHCRSRDVQQILADRVRSEVRDEFSECLDERTTIVGFVVDERLDVLNDSRVSSELRVEFEEQLAPPRRRRCTEVAEDRLNEPAALRWRNLGLRGREARNALRVTAAGHMRYVQHDVFRSDGSHRVRVEVHLGVEVGAARTLDGDQSSDVVNRIVPDLPDTLSRQAELFTN